MNGRRVQGGFFRTVTPAFGGTVKWGTTEGTKTKETQHTGDTGEGGGGGMDPCIAGICISLP